MPQRKTWFYVKHQLDLPNLIEIYTAIESEQGIPSGIDTMFHRNVNNLVTLVDIDR